MKCGFIADPTILELVEADPKAAQDSTSPVLRELVERSVQVKIDVVVADLKETGETTGTRGARSSTTATRWRTRSRRPPTTRSATARRSRSDACSSRSSLGARA
ncbi:3-dehydroquinate synthase family protein [Nocardioides alcanivorans]|uniref:3-dehydroquinate synthase family protein n=1 Tax=Nocardioides alcanivorans TaxID=2897352 RepID=UPI004069857D